MTTKTLLVGALLGSTLTAPAWADGGDRFRSGIDAEGGCFGCGNSVSHTSSTASDVDHEGGRLTERDRQMIASLTNSAWGTLVSISNNQAKYQQDGRTYIRDLPSPPPAPKPRPQPVAHRAVPAAPQPAAPSYTPTTPAYDMGTISAPPLEQAAWAPPPPAQPSVAAPAMSPPTAQLALPERSVPKRRGYADLEPTLRARLPVDTRLPGAKLRRKGEETTAAAVNAAIGFGYGAAFGAAPGGGKVYSHRTFRGIVENGALVALASEARRRRNGGVTPFDADVRGVLNYNERQIREAARDMEGNMTPRQVERFTEAFKKERRQYERREREAARQDRRREGKHE